MSELSHQSSGLPLANVKELDRATAVHRRIPPCGRCGHIAQAHRLDDGNNVSPTDPAAEFRCVGYPQGDTWIDTECDCPDYEAPQ